MPIQTIKCNHCSDTFETWLDAEEHEDDCNYNPNNKKCGTCKHLKSSYGCNWVCELPGTYEYFDKELNCPEHEADKNV